MTTVFFDLGETLITGAPAAWVPSAKALLKTLRDAGYKLGVISNTGGLDRAGLKPHLPIDFDWAAFDAPLIVLSGEVGPEKPDPAIFVAALHRSQGRAVFCTEDLEHSLASQLAGLPCVRVASPPSGDLAQLLDVLQAQGLQPTP